MNQRQAAIVGAGRSGQRLLHALRRNAWTGLQVAYFIDDRDEPAVLHGVRVMGPLANLQQLIEAQPVDAVFIALPADEANRLEDVLEQLDWSMADVRLVPDISPTYAMKPSVSELDDVPILSLRQTPLYGWNALVKRGFDLAVGSLCLLLAAIPMLMIAILIKAHDGGPVFYRQRRMGLDGEAFELVKFRTMRPDAERDGPVWSQKLDARRTPIGGFLRRTSLDELPNLFNVLAGQMSLVGPRPERPEFIAEFKREIPQYMLRHKMKAGMTGFAQIRGLRGETSLRKRIQHDVHYIRNWSLFLDIRILLQTLGGVWFSRHEA
jgi:Undecaprenyl-phosphate glucose phosphotransferase